MYTTNTTHLKATDSVVIPRVYNLIIDWYNLGFRDMDITYTDVFRCVLPLNTMGTQQAKQIGEACRMVEETIHQPIDVILPNLRPSRRQGQWDGRDTVSV